MVNLRIITVFVAVLLAAYIRAENTLQPWQKAAIATRFAAEVKYNYARYDHFGHDFDSICRVKLPEIVNTDSDEAFGRKLTLLANSLGDGHTSVGWSADVTTPPFLQKRVGDRVYVTGVFSDEYSDKGVSVGTELVAINGVPVVSYGESEVVPYIPSSTGQWSRYFPFSSINLTKGPRGVPVTFTFRNGDDKQFDIKEDMTEPWGRANPDMSARFAIMPGNIGLLKLPSFRQDVFNVQRFVDLFEHEVMHTDGLIVDVRDNNGGNSQVGEFVMMFLATDTIPVGQWETPEYEAAFASWGQKWHKKSVDSDPLVPFHMQTTEVGKYDKPIVLLVNAGTFSAAENFVALFRNAGRGKIIGTPTGGSTGNPIIVDLGWGYYGRICTRNEKMADGSEFVGTGICPDIIVEETESVINGDDNVVMEALKILSGKHFNNEDVLN